MTFYKYVNGRESGSRPDEGTLGDVIQEYVKEDDSSGFFRCTNYSSGVTEHRWIPAVGYKAEIHMYLDTE